MSNLKKSRCPQCGSSRWGVTLENEIVCTQCCKPTFKYRYYEQLAKKDKSACLGYEEALAIADRLFDLDRLLGKFEHRNSKVSWQDLDKAVGYALSRKIKA